MVGGIILIILGFLGIKYGIAAIISGVAALGIGLGMKKGS